MDDDIIFAVRRMADGTLYVDWHKSLRDVIDEDGKDTDKLIDLAEEMLEREG
jgi:hypothetical protein